MTKLNYLLENNERKNMFCDFCLFGFGFMIISTTIFRQIDVEKLKDLLPLTKQEELKTEDDNNE